MFTTALFYEVIFYGLVAAVTLPAIDLLVFLIRSGRRSGRAEFGILPAASEAIQDSDPPQQHIGDHAAVPPEKQRQERTENAAGPTRASTRRPGTPRPRRSGNLRSVPDFHESMKGYVASNGIVITPNVIGSARRAMIRSAGTDVSATPATHPHAEYWSYGDTRFYDHQLLDVSARTSNEATTAASVGFLAPMSRMKAAARRGWQD